MLSRAVAGTAAMQALDQAQLRRACDRAAAGYETADFFAAEARNRLLERLDLMVLQPQCILDLGCGTGGAISELRGRYADALLVELDWSTGMLAQLQPQTKVAPLCADSHRLPLADGCVDLIISNLMLPGCADPQIIFSEARRVLRNPGLMLFTTLGPDTLLELRRAWAQVDDYPHVHVFADMHNVGDALVRAGFHDPVMDVEMLTVNYADPDRLFADLRAVAATNFMSARKRGLTTPRARDRLLQALDKPREQSGKLPVRLELVTGQAWTRDPGPGVPLENGEARFPVSRLRY